MSRQRCISLHTRHQTNAAQSQAGRFRTRARLRRRRQASLDDQTDTPNMFPSSYFKFKTSAIRRIQVLAELRIHPERTRLHVDLLGLRRARRGAALRLRRHVRILMRVRVPGRQKTVSKSQYERIEHKKRAQKPSAVPLCFD